MSENYTKGWLAKYVREEVQAFPRDVSSTFRDRLLKKMHAHWRDADVAVVDQSEPFEGRYKSGTQKSGTL